MRRSPADSTNRSLAAFGKLQHIPPHRRPPAPDVRRHATWPQSWMQRENWEFETHRWTEWSWLEPLMPAKDWFFSRDWDKADKLRRALFECFSVQGWSPHRLEEAAYNSQARLYLRTTAQREDRWEKIVREGMRHATGHDLDGRDAAPNGRRD